MSGFDELPETTVDFNPDLKPETNTKLSKVDPIGQDDDDSDLSEFDETLTKLKIRDQILRYNVAFAKYLQAYQEKIINMDDLNVRELEKLFLEVKICVSARTSGNMARRNYNALINGLEYAAPLIGMNLRGLSGILIEDEEVRECIEELNIKYDIMHHVPPEVRLGFLTMNAVLAVNRENKKMQVLVNILEENVTQEHVDEFQDL